MPVFKRTPTMGVSVRMTKQENSATTEIPEAPKYDPTVRPVEPFSKTLLNQHDSGLRIRMHRRPEGRPDEMKPPKIGKLWLQRDHETTPQGAVWDMIADKGTPSEGPFHPDRRDPVWWSSAVRKDHPYDINSGQEYTNWRCRENLSCFSRKDPYTDEVYAGILENWVAYTDAGEKVYITHPFKWLAERKSYPDDIPAVDRDNSNYIVPGPIYFGATTDPEQTQMVSEISKPELCGVLHPNVTLTRPPEEEVGWLWWRHDGFQVFDISDNGRRCLVGWYVPSFFMSYGGRPVQELFGVVELVFDITVTNGRVTGFSVMATPLRYVSALDDEGQEHFNGFLHPYSVWAWVVSPDYFVNTNARDGVPFGGLELELPDRIDTETTRWDQYIQYLGSFYHGDEIRDIIMYNYYQSETEGGSTSGDGHSSVTVFDYGGLYQVMEEFHAEIGPGTDSWEGVDTYVNTVHGRLLNPRVYGDRSDTYLNAWGWTWDAFSIIYGDDWWAETFFDIHGSCRCCSVVMYEGLWWDDDSWDTIGSGSPQKANRSAFLTPNGLVGTKSWMDAGHAVYSAVYDAPSGDGEMYPYWLWYHMLPDKATWNPVTGQVAGPSCLPLAWVGEWNESWEEVPGLIKLTHFMLEDIPIEVECDQDWWLGRSALDFYFAGYRNMP
jgi:hypothetical protein